MTGTVAELTNGRENGTYDSGAADVARRTEEVGVEARAETAMGRMFGPWWLFLITGIAWLIVSVIILRADLGSVAAVAVLTGFVFIFAGVNEFLTAAAVVSWRWLHVLMGIVFIIAGTFAFIRPGSTFLALAAIIGWFLIFKGFLDIVVALSNREFDLWWLGLVVGIAELLIGFWAAGYPGRSVALLIVWVGASALARGIGEVFIAFRLRQFQSV
jgi:uncharacterized membrane protein HdeD (DUF308 family)